MSDEGLIALAVCQSILFARARRDRRRGQAEQARAAGDTAQEAYLRLRDIIVDGLLQPDQRRAEQARERRPRRLDAEPRGGRRASSGRVRGRTLEFHLVDAAISFLSGADENHRPDVLLAATDANGMTIEADGDGMVPRPARVRWSVPCRTLPALRTPYLVFEPGDS